MLPTNQNASVVKMSASGASATSTGASRHARRLIAWVPTTTSS
jgi:hypothetical protein